MSRKMMKLSVLCASLTLAAAMAGCGTSNKEGAISLDSVAKVDETLCAQCHGAAVETLSGDSIYEKYTESVHALQSVGCQDCHGGGAQHNGIGPIPYPKPNHAQCKSCHDDDGLVTAYEGSKHLGADTEDGRAVCNRCHTHQGAVLAAKFHYTGDGEFLEDEANEAITPGVIADPEPIKCNTCHVTHKPNELRVDTEWNPGTVVGAPAAALANNEDRAQYRLCTQCHTYINEAGVLTGSGTTDSGTALVGHHETSWYRVIGTTHYDVPGTPDIEGYGVRTTDANACFDCHDHESKTNTNSGAATIQTEWAASGHAGGLLTAKKAAATANPVNTSLSRTDPVRVAQGLAQVDAVMAASVDGGVWNGHNSTGCNRCHNATGFVGILANPAGTAQPVTAVGQVLTCWGCHTDSASGALRTLSGTTFTNYTGSTGWNPIGYALNYGKKPYPDVKGSNLCIQCHDARERDPGAITDASTTYSRTHYLQAAATMYVKMGFLNLSTGAASGTSSAAYRKTLMSNQDVAGGISSPHRKLGTPAMVGDHGITAADTGLLSNGPCVACHFASGNHTQTFNQKVITDVCVKCHDSEHGHDISTEAAFHQYFLEPQKEAYEAALQLAIDVFNSKATGISLASEPERPQYVRAYTTASLAATPDNPTEAAAAQWTTAATIAPYVGKKTKLMGAISNIVLFKRDPGGYAHARTYSRRLIYDSIDFIDDGVLNMSVGATALATTPAVYGKGAKAYTDGTLVTIAPDTTEAMLYLLKWSRSDGTWGTTERP